MNCCQSQKSFSPHQNNQSIIPNSRYSFKSKQAYSTNLPHYDTPPPTYLRTPDQSHSPNNTFSINTIQHQYNTLKMEEQNLNNFIQNQLKPLEHEISFYQRQTMIRQNQLLQLNGLLQKALMHRGYNPNIPLQGSRYYPPRQ